MHQGWPLCVWALNPAQLPQARAPSVHEVQEVGALCQCMLGGG